MTPKRGLVIGAGSAGNRHARVLQTHFPLIDQIHVSSRDFASWWQTVVSNDDEEFSGIDFAIVASPAPLHLNQAIALADRSIPMLIEKPLTASLEEARSLEKQLNQLSIAAQVGYVLRHTPGFRFLRETLERLGTENISRVKVTCHSFLPDWRSDTHYKESVSAIPELGGGVLMELSHELDYALALFGDMEIESAKVFQSPELGIDVESAAVIEGTLNNGSPVTISLDMGNRNPERFCEVTWKDGNKIRWDVNEETVPQTRADGVVIEIESFSSNRDDWYRRQFEYFLDVVDNSCPPAPSVREAVKTMELVDTVWKHSGREQ